MGDVSGGSQDNPRVKSLVRETATLRAGGDGAIGGVGMG